MTEPKYDAEPDPRARARRAVHPARRPRAELLDERGAQRVQLAGRPVLGGRGGRGGALRPAARRRERAGAEDAAGDRLGRERARVHQPGQERRAAPDGVRPPRVQELRPARHHHQGRGGPGVRGDRAQTRCSTSRSSWSGSRWRTTTSSATSSTRTWTSTRASSTRRWASRWTCSRCCSRSAGCPAGWPSGRKRSTDKEQKIARPRQIYVGETIRHLNGEDGEDDTDGTDGAPGEHG